MTFSAKFTRSWPFALALSLALHGSLVLALTLLSSRNGLHTDSSTPGSARATTTFFQIATEGKAIVYVIDRSASMGCNGFLAAAKRELLASLERLPSTARFQV